jgi:hypothetical protein
MRTTLLLAVCWASLASAQTSLSRASTSISIPITSPSPLPVHVRKGWYDRLTPKQGGPSCLVGPWFTLSAARDWLGSAHYAHSFACHNTGAPADCAPIFGNGYAYPKNYPYKNRGNARVPAQFQIPANDAELLPVKGNPRLYGQDIRLFYGADGSCTVVLKGQKPPAVPGGFTFYSDNQCPGAPYLYVGDRPDRVCE